MRILLTVLACLLLSTAEAQNIKMMVDTNSTVIIKGIEIGREANKFTISGGKGDFLQISTGNGPDLFMEPYHVDDQFYQLDTACWHIEQRNIIVRRWRKTCNEM